MISKIYMIISFILTFFVGISCSSLSKPHRVIQSSVIVIGKTVKEDIKTCPEPNSSERPDLKVGHTCKVPTVETRPGKNEGYKDDEDCKDHQGVCYVQWTLVNKEGDKEIWAAHTTVWGLIYVGDVEDRIYTFSGAEEVCENKDKIVINGKKIKMTLPEIGFEMKGSDDIYNPSNFELLEHLNYASVVPNRGHRRKFWSNSPGLNPWVGNYAKVNWVYQYNSGFYKSLHEFGHSVRCVGWTY